MATTTNLNLGKLTGTEKLKVFPTLFNDNMDIIDGAIGSILDVEKVVKEVSADTYTPSSSEWHVFNGLKYSATKKCLVIGVMSFKITGQSSMDFYFGSKRFRKVDTDYATATSVMLMNSGDTFGNEFNMSANTEYSFGGSDSRQNGVTYFVISLE